MTLRFGPFTLNAAARQLTRDGREIRLPPKAFDLLVLLVERRPAVVDKATLRERLWPATHVVDASLSNLVAEIRALTAGGGAPLLRTVHGVGYAFAGVVEEAPDSGTDRRPVASPCWVVWRERAIELSAGENLIGRDRASAVRLDESGVSRRHATIRVTVDAAGDPIEASLEDLNSTNGTFLRGQAVTSAARLADGDKLRVGSEVLVFRSRASADAPTKRVRRVRRDAECAIHPRWGGATARRTNHDPRRRASARRRNHDPRRRRASARRRNHGFSAFIGTSRTGPSRPDGFRSHVAALNGW
jgi:DNA-binding winged helix-turn-helix (wHTH) protein